MPKLSKPAEKGLLLGHQSQPLAVTLVEQALHVHRQHHQGGEERHHGAHRGGKRHLEPNQNQSPALAKEKVLLAMTRPCHTKNLERRAVLAAARVASLPGNKKESVLVTKLAERSGLARASLQAAAVSQAQESWNIQRTVPRRVDLLQTACAHS